MTDGRPRVRVTLRWIRITDNKEAAWDDEGEFRFRACVSSGAVSRETEFPETGTWSISDHPGRNKVEKIDEVLFEGTVGDSLLVEIEGFEMDQWSDPDPLTPYRREYAGDPRGWVGLRAPADEGAADPERLPDWSVAYDIELI